MDSNKVVLMMLLVGMIVVPWSYGRRVIGNVSGEKPKIEPFLDPDTYGKSQQVVNNGDPEKNDGAERHCYSKCTALCVNHDPNVWDLCNTRCKDECQL